MEASWYCFWTDTWTDSSSQNITHVPSYPSPPLRAQIVRAWERLTAVQAGCRCSDTAKGIENAPHSIRISLWAGSSPGKFQGNSKII